MLHFDGRTLSSIVFDHHKLAPAAVLLFRVRIWCIFALDCCSMFAWTSWWCSHKAVPMMIVCWIFALSMQCGIFITKIVEGLSIEWLLYIMSLHGRTWHIIFVYFCSFFDHRKLAPAAVLLFGVGIWCIFVLDCCSMLAWTSWWCSHKAVPMMIVCWIFALSMQCGIFITKIVEGLSIEWLLYIMLYTSFWW